MDGLWHAAVGGKKDEGDETVVGSSRKKEKLLQAIGEQDLIDYGNKRKSLREEGRREWRGSSSMDGENGRKRRRGEPPPLVLLVSSYSHGVAFGGWFGLATDGCTPCAFLCVGSKWCEGALVATELEGAGWRAAGLWDAASLRGGSFGRWGIFSRWFWRCHR